MPAPWANQDLILSIDSAQPAGSQLGGMAGPQGLQSGTLIATGKGPVCDVGYYKALTLFWVLVSFTGGVTPSFLPELDAVDDALNNVQVFTPDTPALWVPGAAVTVATKWLVGASAHGGLTAPTPAGWTAVAVNFPFGNFVQLAWTIAGAPTNVAWHAFLYGKR